MARAWHEVTSKGYYYWSALNGAPVDRTRVTQNPNLWPLSLQGMPVESRYKHRLDAFLATYKQPKSLTKFASCLIKEIGCTTTTVLVIPPCAIKIFKPLHEDRAVLVKPSASCKQPSLTRLAVFVAGLILRYLCIYVDRFMFLIGWCINTPKKIFPSKNIFSHSVLTCTQTMNYAKKMMHCWPSNTLRVLWDIVNVIFWLFISTLYLFT